MAGVEGRVALVTGAGSAEGIGFATAKDAPLSVVMPEVGFPDRG